MKKTSIIFLSLCALLFLVNCGSGGTNEEKDLATILGDLGVETDIADRVDANKVAVADSVNPLGNSKTVFCKDAEIFFTGADYDGGENSAVFCTSSEYIGADKDPSWAQYYNKCCAADVDGDGYDEVVAMYYNTNEGKLYLRELDRQADTYKNVASQEQSIEDMGYFRFRQCIAAADVDGDGLDEILVANSTLFMIFDNDYSLLYSASYASLNGNEEDACIRFACADLDADGRSEIALANGVDDDDYAAKYYVYKWEDGALDTLNNGNVTNGSVGSQSPNLACGDVDGDSIPEIVFAGEKTDDNSIVVLILDVAMTKKSELSFAFLDTSSEDGEEDQWFANLACGDFNGDGKDEIAYWDELLKLDTSNDAWQLTEYWGNNALDRGSYPDMMAVGDVNDDDIDDIVYVDEDRDDVYVYSINTSGEAVGDDYVDIDKGYENGSLCLPDIDRDSKILAYTGDHELKFTAPRILAVITSPPYWSDEKVEQNLDDTELSLSYIEGSGSETSNTVGFGVSVSFGFSAEAPLLGRTAGSSEIKTTIENEFSWTFSNSKETTVTWTYACAPGEDKVVFTAIPYDIYYYRIVSSPTASEIGTLTTINVPRVPGVYSQSRAFYNEHNGDGLDVDDAVVDYEDGNPFSYPSKAEREEIRKSCYSSSTGKYSGIFTYQDDHVMKVAQGHSYTGISVETLETESESFDYELSVSVEFENVAGGVLVGGGLEMEYGYSYTNSVSKGTAVAVNIGDIGSSDLYQSKLYSYGLMAYPKTVEDQRFTLVTCWVDE